MIKTKLNRKRFSMYEQHVAKWKNCQQCSLSEYRTQVVLARGKVPAEILFIGEAPGASEDIIGQPFIGPAGRLLDHIIDRAVDAQYDYALTNLVGCIPKDSDNDKGEPPKEAILACRDRLLEFIEICQPKLIVSVGLLSKKFTPGEIRPIISITHPAAILRMDVSQQTLAIKRCVVTIEDAISLYL
jgi:DNA polymerase